MSNSCLLVCIRTRGPDPRRTGRSARVRTRVQVDVEVKIEVEVEVWIRVQVGSSSYPDSDVRPRRIWCFLCKRASCIKNVLVSASHCKTWRTGVDTNITDVMRGDIIEVFKITHNIYDRTVSPDLPLNKRANTKGNHYKLQNHTFHYDLLKHFFCTHCKCLEQLA